MIMATEIQKICRLCFGLVEGDMREEIEDIQKEMLDVLLIQVDWSLSENPMLCRQCLTEIQDLFAFKSNCVDIEDYLTPFKKNGAIDLQSVYKKRIGQHNLLEAQELYCRLCIELTEDRNVPNEIEIEKCKLYLPEIDLESTKNLVICSKCYCSLQNYLNFTEKCMKNEQKLCDYCKIVRKRGKRPIHLEKFSEYLTNMSLPLSSVHQFNGKRKVRSKKLDEYKCEFCSFKSNNVTYIRQHTLSHLDLPDTELFKCTMCPLQTKYKNVLNKHMKTNHSDHIYCCNECSFTTKHKISLSRHIIMHKEPTIYECDKCHFSTRHIQTIEKHVCKIKKVQKDKKVLQCPNCLYKTTRSSSLKSHSLKHKHPSEIQMYQCDFCNFQSRQQHSVTRHMLVHKKGEQTVYKCPYCQYETFSTWSLNIHIKTHDDSYDLKNLKKEEYLKKLCEQSYKCTQCSFVTVNTRGLTRHITAMHSDVKPVYKKREVKVKGEKHECFTCGYITYYKSHFERHMKKHQRALEVQIHKCDQCSFETKWAGSLISHKNLHKDPSEIAMFQCPMCTFKTMHRKSIITHKRARHGFTTKTYKCKKCSFETKWRASMHNHETVHAAPKLKCTKCPFRTRYSRSLRNHVRDLHKSSSEPDDSKTRVLPEKKSMQCADCMHKFADKGNMIRHIRNIHGKGVPKLYKCKKCPYVTKWQGSLNTHKIVHKEKENLNLFECNTCDFKSKYKRVLKNHISNRHETNTLF